MKTQLNKAIAAASLLLAFMIPAQAVPIVLNYEGIVSSSDITGAVISDDFLISMVFDNGGSDLISESWDASDFVSVNVSTSSGYSLFGNVLTTGYANFQTDALGMLSVLSIGSIEFSGSDTNGQSFFEIYLNGNNRVLYYTDSFGEQSGYAIGAEIPPNLQNTSISLQSSTVPVPAPASLAFVLLGFGALCLTRRKKI